MAVSITCTKISQDAQGRVLVQFSDGVTLEFPSAAAGREWVQTLDIGGGQGVALLRQMLLRWWILRDPATATPSLVVGKTITFDLSSSTPVVVA